MKTLRILLLLYCFTYFQNLHSQEPCWFNSPPTCKDPNFVYAVGIGQDNDVVKKKNKAEAEAIKTYMAQVHGVQLEEATYKEIVENGLDKLRLSGRPLQYKIVRQGADNIQNNIFYTLLILPRNFLREEVRRNIIFPEEEICDNSLLSSKSNTEHSVPTTKKYIIGQEYNIKIYVVEGYYELPGKIAYIDGSGVHGIVLVDEKKFDLPFEYLQPDILSLRIPTKGKLELIYQNKSKLGLGNEYWSSTSSKKYNHKYTLDFSTGKINSRNRNKSFYHLHIANF